MEKGSTTDKLTSYIDEFGHQRYKYGPPPVELPDDPEWEAYKQMMEEEENADHELSQFANREKPRHCPIPKDDVLEEKYKNPDADWYGVTAPWGG